MKRHEEIAEKIITTEGLMFALASAGGKEGDLRKARGYLKLAIVKALESEWQSGINVVMSGDI
jgi:hypothetical protein